MKTTMLSIDLIRVDGGTQPRAEVNLFTVADYSASMLDGAVFPPVTVFFDGKAYWLGDGFHRLAACSDAGQSEILSEVRKGTQSDAQWFSFSANRTHGLRRTNDDKRRAIVAALSHPNGQKLSDHQIAEHCGVTHQFVGKIRGELTSNGCQSEQRLGRDGRIINTANIGKSLASRVMESLHDQGLISDMPPREQLDPDGPEEGNELDALPLPAASGDDGSWPRVRRGARLSDVIRILADVDNVEDYATGLWEIDPLGTQFVNRLALARDNLRRLQSAVESKRKRRTRTVTKAEIAAALGTSEEDIIAAEQHVETAQKYPFMQADEWRECHVLAVRDALQRLPENERDAAVAMIAEIDPDSAVFLIKEIVAKMPAS